MDPQDYLDKIKSTVDEDVKDGILHNEATIQSLALTAQAQVLGFSYDHQFKYVTKISKTFATELTEGSKKEIELLRKKIQASATKKIKNIIDIEVPRLANYAFEQEIQKIIADERAKALPIIRKVIKQVVHEQLVTPWEAIAKMQANPISNDIDEDVEDVQDIPF